MATRRETIRFEGEGSLDKELKNLAKSADGLAESMDKSAKAAEDAGKKSDSLGTKSAKLALGFNQIQQAAQQIGGTLAALVDQYAQVDAAQGRLVNSFSAASGGARELAQAEELATEMARRGQATRLDSINNLRTLADASGDARTALLDYRLAIDVASQANISAEQATSLLAKARNGEVEALKDLRGLNKDTAADLGKVEDASLRAELAVQFLRESYEGAAEANAGLIDKQNALKFSLDDAKASAGNLAGAIGSASAGLVLSVGKLAGVLGETKDPITTITTSFNGFANAIREATQPVKDLVEAGGDLADVVYGVKSIFDIISEADTKRAITLGKKKKASEDAAEATKEETGATEEQVTAEVRLTQALEAQAVAKEKAKPRKKSTGSRKKEVDTSGFEGDFRSNEEIEKDREKQIIQLEKEDALARELELRDAIAQLEIDGRDLDAERMRILNSSMTDLEKQVQLNQLAADAKEREKTASKEAISATLAQADAYGAVATGLLEVAGAGEAATIAQAALDGAKATYLAGIEFGLGNFLGAAALGVAAAQAFALAGQGVSSAVKGGGGGGASKAGTARTSSVGQQARENRGATTAQPRETGMTINVNTLSYVSPEDARRIATAEARQATSTVGGRR